MDKAATLFDIRRASGMSRADVGFYAHVSDARVADWEAGRALPTDTQYGLLSMVYGVPESVLRAAPKPDVVQRMRQKALEFESPGAARAAKEAQENETADVDGRETLKREAAGAARAVRNALRDAAGALRDAAPSHGTATVTDAPVRTIEWEVTPPAREDPDQTLRNIMPEPENEAAQAHPPRGLSALLARGVPFSAPMIAALYLALGIFLNAWHPAWLLFLTLPLDFDENDTLWDRLLHPVTLTLIYFVMGIYLNLWHPGWLVFMAIPIFNHRRKDVRKTKKRAQKDKKRGE